jgi:hypothetical protein
MLVYRLRHTKSGGFWKGSGKGKRLSANPKIFTTRPTKKDFGSFPELDGKVLKPKDFTLETCKLEIISQSKWVDKG